MFCLKLHTPQAYKETSLNDNILILIFKLLKLLPLSTSMLRHYKVFSQSLKSFWLRYQSQAFSKMSPGMDIHPFSLCQRWKLYTQQNMQLSITCIVIAPQRPEWWPECDQVQVIELKPFTSVESLLHSKVPSETQKWIPWMDEMLAVCWESSLGLMQGVQDLLQTLIYLLKLCFPVSEHRATASNPWERETLWRGNLNDYKPSYSCYNLFPKKQICFLANLKLLFLV